MTDALIDPPSATDAAMLRYLDARGLHLAFDEPSNAEFVVEEASELAEALANGDRDHARLELGDVVFAAAVLARANGWTLEECMLAKTAHDTGRGRGRRRNGVPRQSPQVVPRRSASDNWNGMGRDSIHDGPTPGVTE